MCVFVAGVGGPQRGWPAGGGFQYSWFLDLERGAGLVGGPCPTLRDVPGIGGHAACREAVLRVACMRFHPSYRVGKAEVM